MNDKSKKSFFLFLLGVLILAAFNAGAAFAVPQTINYQGYLTDPDGIPLDVTVDMTFSIYDVAVNGVAVAILEVEQLADTDQGGLSRFSDRPVNVRLAPERRAMLLNPPERKPTP